MTKRRPAIDALSQHLLRVFPELDATDQKLSLTLYRVALQTRIDTSSVAEEKGAAQCVR